MFTEKQIKIIKHEQRNDSQTGGLAKRRTSVQNHLEETKQDAVATVTGWISELRRKKAEEARHGIDSVFGSTG